MEAFNDRYAGMEYEAIDFYDMMGDMLYYEWIFIFATVMVLMLQKVSKSK